MAHPPRHSFSVEASTATCLKRVPFYELRANTDNWCASIVVFQAAMRGG